MADPRLTKADVAAEKARAKAMRPWYKKKRFIIPLALVALLIIIAVAGAGTDTANDTDTNVATDAPTTAPEATDDDDARLFPGRPDYKKGDKERNIGQPAELSGYTVTVTKAAFQQRLSQFEDDGYIVADVTMLNRDDKAQSYNPFDWKLITPGGQIIDPTFSSAPGGLTSGDLVQGGSVSGKLTWEAGAQKGDFYIIYDPPDFGDERAVWKATV